MRNSVARLGTRYQLFFGSEPRSPADDHPDCLSGVRMLPHRLFRRVAGHAVACRSGGTSLRRVGGELEPVSAGVIEVDRVARATALHTDGLQPYDLCLQL